MGLCCPWLELAKKKNWNGSSPIDRNPSLDDEKRKPTSSGVVIDDTPGAHAQSSAEVVLSQKLVDVSAKYK